MWTTPSPLPESRGEAARTIERLGSERPDGGNVGLAGGEGETGETVEKGRNRHSVVVGEAGGGHGRIEGARRGWKGGAVEARREHRNQVAPREIGSTAGVAAAEGVEHLPLGSRGRGRGS